MILSRNARADQAMMVLDCSTLSRHVLKERIPEADGLASRQAKGHEVILSATRLKPQGFLVYSTPFATAQHFNRKHKYEKSEAAFDDPPFPERWFITDEQGLFIFSYSKGIKLIFHPENKVKRNKTPPAVREQTPSKAATPWINSWLAYVSKTQAYEASFSRKSYRQNRCTGAKQCYVKS